MLKFPIDVWVLDKGQLPQSTKWYWNYIRSAQLHEVGETFDQYTTVEDLDAFASLPIPSILVIPVLAGGCISKRQWWAFRHALRRYRRRGGVVVVLGEAFCLPEEGKRARGRNFEGIYTSGQDNWLGNPITLPGTTTPITPENGGFWVEHLVAQDVDSRVGTLSSVSGSDRTLPLVIRYSDPGSDIPGAMVFLNTWSWMRSDLMHRPRSKAARNAGENVDKLFTALRQVNREAVMNTIKWVLGRMSDRTARLEALSGEGERLSRRMGSEKDYQRLLANDFDLCLDVLSWRALVDSHVDSTRLREGLAEGWLWPEPPHRKQQRAKGRLDLLLLPKDQGPDGDKLAALEAWLADPGRGPVAWVELEAGEFHARQMKVFYAANKQLLGPGDFIVAVDRSLDDAVDVAAFSEQVTAVGHHFLHVQVPSVFDRLEEHYAPTIHRALRKRFTSEVIRGLIG